MRLFFYLASQVYRRFLKKNTLSQLSRCIKLKTIINGQNDPNVELMNIAKLFPAKPAIAQADSTAP